MSQGDLSYLITTLQQREVFCVFRSLLKKKGYAKRMVIVGLNTSIPLEVGLNALREALEKKLRKPFQWRNIENSRIYALKKYSQFCNETRKKILRMGSGLICPTIRLDFLRQYFKFLAGQHLQPLILFR